MIIFENGQRDLTLDNGRNVKIYGFTNFPFMDRLGNTGGGVKILSYLNIEPVGFRIQLAQKGKDKIVDFSATKSGNGSATGMSKSTQKWTKPCIFIFLPLLRVRSR